MSDTIGHVISSATKQLQAAQIDTARLDILILLEDMLSTDRTQILARQDDTLTNEQIGVLQQAVARRAKHEPLAYIRGKSDFFGRTFQISADTLQPRPETETLVQNFLDWARVDERHLEVVDVGTGSGAIAITIKKERLDLKVMATDISQAALEIAEQNADEHNVEILFSQGNLLEPLHDQLQRNNAPAVLLCNLPYVPDAHTINDAAMFEPKLAIFGGTDGLELYRKLFEQTDTLTSKPVAIFTESLPFQHHGLATIARKHSYVLEATDDFIQRFELTA